LEHILSLLKRRIIKVLFCGDSGVGKTTLIESYKNMQFIPQRTTIGVNFATFTNKGYKVLIIDAAGQPRFFPIIRRMSILKGVDIACLCFDASRPETLEVLMLWKEVIDIWCPQAKLLLVACKCDLVPMDELINMAERAAARLGCIKIYYTSAKELKFDNLFEELIKFR